jgi:hypothetical protein
MLGIVIYEGAARMANPIQGQYPGIASATLLMALDNGGINRDRSQEDLWDTLATFLVLCLQDAAHAGVRAMIGNYLRMVDNWISTLSTAELDTLCAGEQSEAAEIAQRGPEGVGDFLNMIFDNVV